MNTVKKDEVNADAKSIPATTSGNPSNMFTARVAILRDEWREMIGFSVQFMESEAANAQAVYVDEDRMLLGGSNAEGKQRERAMRFFDFSNWDNISGRINVDEKQRIQCKVDGKEKCFVSGFNFRADDALGHANYLGLRMVEGMFMPEGDGYYLVSGGEILKAQFDTAYYFITPNSEDREVTAIQEEMWVFPIIYAFYIASGNNKFPDYKYREGIRGLAQWYQMKDVPFIDLLEHLWAQGPRRWMPLYHGLARVISELGLINVEKSIYDFFKRHEESSGRIFSVRLLGAMKTGVSLQYLERTIKPQLISDDPVAREIERQLEGVILSRSNQTKGYAPIFGLTRIADDVLTSIASWSRLGDLFVPFWARDFAQLARSIFIPDQKKFNLKDARVRNVDFTRFEQDFEIEGHSFTTRFTPDLDAGFVTVDLLETPKRERSAHHKFGSLRLVHADDGKWHITAMHLIRLDHIFVNTLKYVLLVMAFQYIRFLQAAFDSRRLVVMVDSAVFSFNPSPFDIVTFRRLGIIPQTRDLQNKFDFKAARIQRDGGRMMNLRYIEVPSVDKEESPLNVFIEGPENYSVIVDSVIYDEAIRIVKTGEGKESQLIIKLLNDEPVEVIYAEEEDLGQSEKKVSEEEGNILVPITGAQRPQSFTLQSVLISGVSCELKEENVFRRTLDAEPAINFEELNRQRLLTLCCRE